MCSRHHKLLTIKLPWFFIPNIFRIMLHIIICHMENISMFKSLNFYLWVSGCIFLCPRHSLIIRTYRTLLHLLDSKSLYIWLYFLLYQNYNQSQRQFCIFCTFSISCQEPLVKHIYVMITYNYVQYVLIHISTTQQFLQYLHYELFKKKKVKMFLIFQSFPDASSNILYQKFDSTDKI